MLLILLFMRLLLPYPNFTPNLSSVDCLWVRGGKLCGKSDTDIWSMTLFLIEFFVWQQTAKKLIFYPMTRALIIYPAFQLFTSQID